MSKGVWDVSFTGDLGISSANLATLFSQGIFVTTQATANVNNLTRGTYHARAVLSAHSKANSY